MNCLEFRRAMLADPSRCEGEATRHVFECSACRQFHLEGLGVERQLRRALRIAVPHGLQEQLVRRLDATRWRRWCAMAAAFVIAVAIGFVSIASRDDPLALAGIEFVVFEEAQAIADAKPADKEVLAKVSRALNVSFPAQLGEARYIGPCPFGGVTAHHVLLKTSHGKVTLLLIPGRSLASRASAAAHGLAAAVVPAGNGGIAIIGPSPRSITRTEAFLRSTRITG
jgi:hypothetical protein